MGGPAQTIKTHVMQQPRQIAGLETFDITDIVWLYQREDVLHRGDTETMQSNDSVQTTNDARCLCDTTLHPHWYVDKH
jgi:hypothetical protein